MKTSACAPDIPKTPQIRTVPSQGHSFPERGGLFPPQAEVLDKGLLKTGFNCVLQMPTGSGKTFLAQCAISTVLASGFKAIYLAPLKALAAELQQKWTSAFREYRIGVFTGDYGKPNTPFPVPFEKADLLIMTPERLDACTRNWRNHWKWIPQVDLIVADEFHLLGDAHRGARLEGALCRFARLNPFSRLLALSATLGNLRQLADWLGGVEYASTWRPVPLRWTTISFSKASEKPGKLLSALKDAARSGGHSLVFVQSRRRAESLSCMLTEHGFRAAHHHAGQDIKKRKTIEEGFQSGQIDILVATSTLEMGLNLPVRRVYLYDLQHFDGDGFSPLSSATVWQRGGRAGRPGLDQEGEVVLIEPRWEKTGKEYEKGIFEDVRSRLFDPVNLAEQIIAEVSSGLSTTPHQILKSLQQTLAFQQGKCPSVLEWVRKMEESGMLRQHPEKNGRLQATRLGRIIVRSMLLPETVLLFKRIAESFDDLSFYDLLLLVTISADCEPVIPADYEELPMLASQLAGENSTLLKLSAHDLAQSLRKEGKGLLASMKMALILRQWTRGHDMERLAESFSCYPFEISRLKDSAERLLAAMASVFKTEKVVPDEVLADFVPLAEKITVLSKMVQGGFDEITATLSLVEGIGTTWAKKLSDAGCTDIEELALAETDDLPVLKGLSRARLSRWIESARDIIKTRSSYRFREDKATNTVCSSAASFKIDIYRLKRAKELKVEQRPGQVFSVSGGLEPHRVRQNQGIYACDCADFEKGNLCKHILAVRLYRKEKEILHILQQTETVPADHLDLQALWSSGLFSRRPDMEGRV